jgi:hypothetical protein
VSDLNQRISEIVTALEREGRLGERFKGHTEPDAVRFGTHGSLKIEVRGDDRGLWYDHEAKDGGDAWSLIHRSGHDDVLSWARDHHLLDDRPRDVTPKRITYDYVDERGALLFQVVRFPDHQFRQRKPEGDGWSWKLGNTRRVLYHLPELIAAKKTGNGHPWRAYLCEGEKDVDRVRADWGVVATTNPGGAGYWRSEFNAIFAGGEVILLEDNDPAGRERSAKLAPQLARAGAAVRIIRLYPRAEAKSEPHYGKDISDWLDEGGSQSVLDEIIEQTEPFQLNGHDPASNGHDTEDWKPPPWTLDHLANWAGRLIPAREWIMEDWIPRGQTTGLYGVSGVYKSTFLIQLMIAAAAGLNFCGLPIAQVPVYGLFCEDTIEEVVRRAIRITQFYGLDFIRFPNFHFGSLVGVMDSELLRFDHEGHKFGPAYQLLQDQLATIRPGLVVLDTLPDFFGGNEIDRRQTSIFIRMLDRISMLHDCAIVCSAHPSMRGRSSGRFDSGNTGIEGKMRARLSLHDPGDGNEDDGESPEERAHRIALNPTEKRILTRQNSNYAKPGETIELTIKDGVFTPAALDVNAGPSRNLSIRAKFLECLRAIKQEGRTVHDVSNSPSRYAPKVFRAHPLNRPTRFSMRDFETAMNELIGSNPPRIKLGRDRRSPFLYEV